MMPSSPHSLPDDTSSSFAVIGKTQDSISIPRFRAWGLASNSIGHGEPAALSLRFPLRQSFPRTFAPPVCRSSTPCIGNYSPTYLTNYALKAIIADTNRRPSSWLLDCDDSLDSHRISTNCLREVTHAHSPQFPACGSFIAAAVFCFAIGSRTECVADPLHQCS